MDAKMQAGLMILGAIILYKLVDKVIDYFWNRTAKANYLTVEEFQIKCAECHKNNNTDALYTELSQDIKQVKEILLLVALKIPGVEHNDLKGLVQ